MTTIPQDVLLQFWKSQLDASLRLLETLTESAMRVYEAQLEAATEAHADAEATRKAVLAAADTGQVLRLYTEWARANTEKSAAYCRSLMKALPTPAAPAGLDLGMMDSAYKQWVEGVKRLYEGAVKPNA
ncbi:MAG TPA: phasin family protein [Burkholderiales bacterium]|nr:phasin family protein [Burkholderiales bacterium]